ncbi:MAG: IS110 family transposase [Woeseiaceae bacterium]
MNPVNLVGIDVSDATFDAKRRCGEVVSHRRFDNTAGGHRQAIRWMLHGADEARVCLEATGIYHLQLSLALAEAAGIELMVLNPRASRRFAEAKLTRAKTDKVDADGLLEYLQRMPFRPWPAPDEEILELQSLAHRLTQLQKEQRRERSRLHAARRAGAQTRIAQSDIRDHLGYLVSREKAIKSEAIALMKRHEALAEDLRLIDTAPGFAELSCMKLLAEIKVMPENLRAPQWVAQAGLDPQPRESGNKKGPRQISKQGNSKISAALFYPAMTAKKHDPNVKAFYESLIARGKKPMQAIVAVMRKLLHAIWGMLHHRQPWDGDKFYRLKPVKST